MAKNFLTKLAIAGVTVGFLAAFSPASAATVLLQDNFDSENGGIEQTNYFDFVNWDVVEGSVDLIGNGFFDFFPGNGLYLDLDGSTFNAGTLVSKTAFMFDPNQIIELSFDLLGQNPGATANNIVTVSLGSLFEETFSVADAGTVTRNFIVGTLTTANLEFNHAGGDRGGLILDNVMLTVESVPEPSSVLSLLAFGTFGVGSLLKRK